MSDIILTKEEQEKRLRLSLILAGQTDNDYFNRSVLNDGKKAFEQVNVDNKSEKQEVI